MVAAVLPRQKLQIFEDVPPTERHEDMRWREVVTADVDVSELIQEVGDFVMYRRYRPPRRRSQAGVS